MGSCSILVKLATPVLIAFQVKAGPEGLLSKKTNVITEYKTQQKQRK
jgi:hypothetical protein